MDYFSILSIFTVHQLGVAESLKGSDGVIDMAAFLRAGGKLTQVKSSQLAFLINVTSSLYSSPLLCSTDHSPQECLLDAGIV